jgi:FlaA1/EpsC-like NDP-sugar epimerase
VSSSPAPAAPSAANWPARSPPSARKRLILLDNGEYALWQIDLELAETHPQVRRHALIADIRDEARIRAVFEAMRPELVFHAAALKHVPIVEDNPLEGLLTNAAGTRHVADAARAVGRRRWC